MNHEPAVRDVNMPPTVEIPRTNRLAIAGLWLRVQADAFRFDPAGYVQALLWRARGLKLRSRNRMAALAGRSAFAYRYWVASKEPRLRLELAASSAGPQRAPAIIPVIDCTIGSAGLEETLASIPGSVRPIIVGGVSAPRSAVAVTLTKPSELAQFAGGGSLWLCPIGCGDRFAPGAIEAYAGAIHAQPGASLIYADDDLCDDSGNRSYPHFKPDWNPELFEWHDYLSGSCVLSASADQLAGLPEKGWSEALVHRLVESGARPSHLRHILHHRQSRPEPVLPPAGQLAIETAPLVSVIIPTRDRSQLLRKCIEGVEQTDYPAMQVIVIDNDSNEPETLALLDDLNAKSIKVIHLPGPFNFSALNNLAVEHASGELLCFLNNDVEISDPHWLSFLVGKAMRPELGAVGARLLYADHTIQHAGVFTGIGGGAGHAHRFQHSDERGYFERSRLPQRVSAVTAACLVVAKHKFQAVGGFDEETFAVAFNDVDLCLKLNAKGWQSFYEPRATLIHHESKSRGSDRLKANRGRFAEELAALKRKWGTDRERDPFHHPNLSPFCEQFLIAL